MKNSIIFLFVALITFSNVLYAKPASKSKKQIKPDKAVRSKMNTISGTIRNLGPFIASDSEFLKEKNKKYIEEQLLGLSQLFKNLKIHHVVSIQGLSVNQAVMTEQLEQTVNLFKANKKSLARAKFNAALNLCIGCHTQSPGQELPKIFLDKDIEKMKLSNFEKAELYFISRDYAKAMMLYDQFISASKKTDDDEFIFLALERQLIYFVRIKKNFAEAKEHFEKYLKANLLNDTIKDEVTEWNKSLSNKSLWENFDPALVKEEEMEKFMKGFIADDEEGPIFTVTNSSEVYDLNLSTILLDYYNAHPETKLGARILYWLAVLDKRINDDLFFSVGDYYLLSCMEKYNKDPMAQECYDAYVEELELNYLSKEKKEFPKDIRERLNSLKKLINYKDQ